METRFFQEMVMDAPYPFSQPGLIPRAGRVLQGWWKKPGMSEIGKC